MQLLNWGIYKTKEANDTREALAEYGLTPCGWHLLVVTEQQSHYQQQHLQECDMADAEAFLLDDHTLTQTMIHVHPQHT